MTFKKFILQLRGLTFAEAAAALNAEGYRTARGLPFTAARFQHYADAARTARRAKKARRQAS
jgi:hypothetical protein